MAKILVDEQVTVTQACQSLNVPRATFYRHRSPKKVLFPRAKRPSPPRRIPDDDRQIVLDLLNDQRFVDLAPAQVFARLLEEGRYLCSIRTMYRILHENKEVRERRKQLRHPSYAVPRFKVTRPNQLWTWDITKLKGPVKWKYYYLYVIIDVYSRYVVGWLVGSRESSARAQRLIESSCKKQGILPSDLTLHADRGPSMTSKGVAQLLTDLGIAESHSRPRVSNDNAFSESQFKTIKYRPQTPEFFNSQDHASSWTRETLEWYNHEHHHKGIAYLTPAQVHYGQAPRIQETRAAALRQAYEAHPERFVHGPPTPPQVPDVVWLNRPTATVEDPQHTPTPKATLEPLP